jgi:hypothetical protein
MDPSTSTSAHASDSRITAVQSGSAAVRLGEARRFLAQFEPGAEVLLVGASRGSVDDLARSISLERGATFGLHRLSFTQLAARLAIIELASHDHAPMTALGHEAVATRAAFEGPHRCAIALFLANLANTWAFRRLWRGRSGIETCRCKQAAICSGCRAVGLDLAHLLDRVDTLVDNAGASDRAALFQTAIKALGSPLAGWPPLPLLLLDVPLTCTTEGQFLWELVQQSPRVMITIPAGDMTAVRELDKRGVRAELRQDRELNDLTQLSRYIFSQEPPPQRQRTGELEWFSAPGEGRECVEIARRILRESERGVRFDEIAVVIRSAAQYVGLLEHALGRAGVPAYFDRGTRRPDPAGHAFLAILNCVVENFSAKRFAEYLSLGQVPGLDPAGTKHTNTPNWVASGDEIFGVLSERASHVMKSKKTRASEQMRKSTPTVRYSPAPCERRGNGRACWLNPP